MEAGRHSTRPELFAPPLAATGGERRILATLDHGEAADTGPRMPPHARQLTLALGTMLVLVLACGVAWISYIAITPGGGPEFAINTFEAPVAATPGEAEKLAAAIINEPLQVAAARLPVPARAAAFPVATGVGGRAPQAHGKTSSHARTDGAARSPARAGDDMKASAGRDASGVAEPPPEDAQRAGAAPGQAGKDSDVTLLAALVAHGGVGATVPAGAADGASALQWCDRLRASEAALCRMRVCSSQWQHEAACRQAAARESD